MTWQTFVSFGLAGGCGVVANYSTTWCLREFGGVNQFVANNIGLGLGLALNFTFNKMFTFGSTAPWMPELASYACIAALSLAINHLLVHWMVTNKLCTFYLAKLVSTGLLFLWNYFMHSHFTFS